MNIYQRLQAVMQEVSYIKKDATVTAGGTYKAVTHDMVTAVVRPHFVKAGIVVVPRLIDGAVVSTGRQTSKGTDIIRYEGRYEVSFVNVDDPQDVCVVPVSAHAEDQGDKAPGKALSYATKYAILKALMLESGESDEGRVPEDAPEPLTDAELDGLKKRLGAAKNTAELHDATKDAFAVCKKANDKEAHAAIKAYSLTLAANMAEGKRAA